MKMKTGLKSIAAAAIAAFTFGFAPSAMAASITVTQAQQRYPWSGHFDITYTASGIAEACGSTKVASLKVWAVNPATQEEQIATAACLSGSTTMDDGTHSIAWDMDTQKIFQGVTTGLKIYVTAMVEDKPKPKGVQLWKDGPYFATYNIGANKPEEYGHYFWWGGTIGYKRNAENTGWVSATDGTKFSFTEGNCPTYGKTAAELVSAGYIVSTTDLCLKPEHDAAAVNWSSDWRIMTKDEATVLASATCKTTWTENYNGTGVKGRIIQGNTDGYKDKEIFMPAAGCGYGDSIMMTAAALQYWISRLYDGTDTTSLKNSSYYLNSYMSYNFGVQQNQTRYYALPIRPVSTKDPSNAAETVNGDPEPLCTGEIDAAADLRTGETRNAAATETLTYTRDFWGWGTKMRIFVNNKETWVLTESSGTVEWTPDPNFVGEYTLELKNYNGSAQYPTIYTAKFNSPKEELSLKDASGNTVDVKLNRSWAAEKTGTTDPTAQATALNAVENNKHRKWENEILGLNGSVSTSIPVISPVQTSDAGKVGFRLSGVNVDTTSGASVSNKVWKGSTPGAHTTGYGPYLYTEQVDVPVPESGVQYYDIEVLIK